MKTIKAKLIVYLLGALLVASALSCVVLYQQVQEEAGELSDYQLTQVARAFPNRFPTEPEDSAASPENGADETSEEPGDIEEDIVVFVWNAKGKQMYSSRPALKLLRSSGAGFHDIVVGNTSWRALVHSNGNWVIEVAQPMAVRSSMAVQLALRSLIPFLVLVPLLGLVIALVVDRSLQPIRLLTDSISSRSPQTLSAFEVNGLPPELQPMLDALNALLARLKAANEAQRDFVADAAHELRTPLAALQLQLQLAERARTEEARHDAFSKVGSRLERAGHLVQQLLDLARSEAEGVRLEMGDIDLAQVAGRVISTEADLAEARQIVIHLDSPSRPVTVRGNVEALEVLLGNLLSNAIRHSPDGGPITVSVGLQDGQPMISVTDSGPGIPVVERKRVFDRFYRRSGTEGGSGLGLAIARNIADAHGARLTLQDGPDGKGLEVSIKFPRSSPTPKSDPGSEAIRIKEPE